MTVRTSVVTALFLSASLFASADADRDDQGKVIQSKLSSIMDKAGIHFNGTFRSQYLQSMLNNEASGDSAVDWRKKQTESNEFTSVDFDIGARPNDALSARCMFRMHQNWQNFFSDVSNPIFLRWLSIDGNVKDMIRFNVGDFRQRYSPLTLWSPDIDIAYEPEIFAQKRREAMKEVFLGDNDRLLQGVNFNLDAELFPIFNELHVNAMGTRLRLSQASVQSGSAVAADFEGSPFDETYMDRYDVSANVDILALKGLGVGLTVLDLFDLPATNNFMSPDSARLIARQTLVMGFRLAPSTKIFIDSDRFDVGINFEAAQSMNRDSAWYDVVEVVKSGKIERDSTLKSTSINGLAMNAGLCGNVKLGDAGSIRLNVGFMNNSADFVNEMAQSPTFLGQRIMNIENDFERNSRMYTTFDALYDYVFKFTPSANNSWSQQPRRKISYTNAVLSKEELAAVDGSNVRYDSTLQLVLPAGQATPNRTGPKGDLALKLFNGGIDAGVNFAMLDEIEANDLGGKNSFLKFGGGLAIDLATWLKVLNMCKLSFGYSVESSEYKERIEVDGPNVKFASNFLNAGIYYNVWQRFSLLGGFQQIVGTKDIGGVVPYTRTVTQTHFAAGLEYKVSEGQRVIGRIGQLGADFESTSPADSAIADFNFKATQVEVYLTVNF